jgi:hypothetical protein
VNVSSTRLVEVITASARDVGNCRRHRDLDSERGARGRRGASAETDENTSGTLRPGECVQRREAPTTCGALTSTTRRWGR